MRQLPFRQPEVFDIVADIERYPEFVPGCRDARILERNGARLLVEQEMGLGGPWSWRFRTDARLERPSHIRIATQEHPFRHLDQCWLFEPIDHHATALRLQVDYELRSRTLERLAGRLLEEGFEQTLAAFATRAREQIR
jgi:coenzyme Q-binding protein COQ10